MVASQPKPLIFVVAAVPQVFQNFAGCFAPAQKTAQLQFVNQIGRPERDLGEKLRAIEQQQQQFEQRRIARPGFVECGARAVSGDVAVESCEHTVGIGQRFCGQSDFPGHIPFGAQGKKLLQKLQRQVGGPRRDMNKARTEREGFHQAKCLLHLRE